MENKGIIVKLLVQGHLAMLQLMAGLESCFNLSHSKLSLHGATLLEERKKGLGEEWQPRGGGEKDAREKRKRASETEISLSKWQGTEE